MAGNTGSPFNLRYPTSGDQVNVHGDIQNLATDVASALNGIAFKNNSNTFAATNIFSASSADPIITVTQSGSGAAISTTGKIIAGEFELSGGTSSQFLKADGSTDSNSYSLSNHTHGNITNDGKIGSIPGQVVITTTNGALTTLTAGTSGQFLKHDATWAIPPDTNTTYTFGSGTINGAFSVTPSGGSAESVSIFGLKSAAFTESTDYATSTHTHSFADITSKPTTLSGYGILDAQPSNTNLTGISSIDTVGNPVGFIKRLSGGTYQIDTTQYVTPSFSITLAGGVSGTGAINATINTTLAAHAPSHEASGGDELKGNLRLDTLISGAVTLDKVTYPHGLNRMHRVSGTFTITLPQNDPATNKDYPIGSQLNFLQTGLGTITFAATTGLPTNSTVIFNGSPSKNKMTGIGAVATAIKTDTNTWYVFGNLSA